MFSLQTQNQVLYYLSQLTSSVSPKCVSTPVRIKRQEECLKKTTEEKAHTDHADVSQVLTDRINMCDVATLYKMKRNNVWLILDQLSMSTCKRHLAVDSKWRVSYISGSSFAENKRNFPCAQLTAPIIMPAILLNTKTQHRSLFTHSFDTPHGCHMQTRGFKTKLKGKETQTPGVTGVFKKFFSPEKTTTTAIPHDIRQMDMEQIKHLFDSNHVSPEDLSKIKLAFVEGYEVGLNKQLSGNRGMKVMQALYLCSVILMLVLCGLVYLSGPFKFPISQDTQISPETVSITFDDVQGVDEAKQELRDVVEFLKNPEKFTALGGKLPKGVLLIGPPGTGKTLLARAVAGEAGVPFFHAAGPEFDEVLVGQGARRIRDLFKAAKEKAPAVIFIDEIDSVGGMRTQSLLHPYANQTINQLLSEMDGFLQNEGVIVLGATNRHNDLDKALTRPGRFDIEIQVNRPDLLGRKDILGLYISKITSQDIDVEYLARCTVGFTGAEIENMINQAALKAAVDNEKHVTMKHVEYARDKVLMGPEGKLKGTDEQDRRITACHEAGHALVCFYTDNTTNVHKVTIIPRGNSRGHTAFVNKKDFQHITKSQLIASMDSMMGGRAAEELFFGTDNVTTGAAVDFKLATSIAEDMVKTYGMSEKVGFRCYTDSAKQPFMASGNEYSSTMTELIDLEVKRLLQESYDRAKALLRRHVKEHQHLVDALLKYETLDGEDVKAILTGQKPPIELNGSHRLIG